MSYDLIDDPSRFPSILRKVLCQLFISSSCNLANAQASCRFSPNSAFSICSFSALETSSASFCFNFCSSCRHMSTSPAFNLTCCSTSRNLISRLSLDFRICNTFPRWLATRSKAFSMSLGNSEHFSRLRACDLSTVPGNRSLLDPISGAVEEMA